MSQMKIPFESLSPAMQSLVLFVKKYDCRESAKTFLESLCKKTSSCKNKRDYTLTIQFLSLDT